MSPEITASSTGVTTDGTGSTCQYAKENWCAALNTGGPGGGVSVGCSPGVDVVRGPGRYTHYVSARMLWGVRWKRHRCDRCGRFVEVSAQAAEAVLRQLSEVSSMLADHGYRRQVGQLPRFQGGASIARIGRRVRLSSRETRFWTPAMLN